MNPLGCEARYTQTTAMTSSSVRSDGGRSSRPLVVDLVTRDAAEGRTDSARDLSGSQHRYSAYEGDATLPSVGLTATQAERNATTLPDRVPS